jgi:hypothetical protein
MSTGLSACASNDSESLAVLDVNEAGEYVFDETQDDWDEVVCKRQKIAGSHVPQRVCKTRAQLEDEREEALESVGPLAPMAGDELQRVH